MGSNRLISKDKSKVERTSLTKTFEEMCPIFMSYGMTYDEFWYKSPYRAKYYKDAHNLKVRQEDEKMWIQGMYIYEAFCKVSPILHAFSKKGTKPLPYATKPYMHEIREKTKAEKEQERKNAQLIARLHFEKWAKDTKKKFENKK